MLSETTDFLWAKDVRPRLKMKFEKNQYIVKTAETWAEIEGALRLRHEVFCGEMLNTPLPSGLNTDQFDPLCDHLIIQTLDTKDVIGTYRLNSSAPGNFYSEQEFEMDAVLRFKERKLEVGRACVAREHRHTMVFNLLFLGLAAYLQKAEIRYVFGCSSVPVRTHEELTSLCQFFRLRHFSPENLRVRPLHSTADPFSYLYPKSSQMSDDEVQLLIPPILKLYLHLGCWLCGEPYYDSEFKVYDFFTLLDMKNGTPALHKLFKEARQAAGNKDGGYLR